MRQPLIKWTGSKRKLAKTIISYFPEEIDTYYEPFLGGGSVFLQLLKNNHNVQKYIVSDININSIDIFNIVRNNPNLLIEEYTKHWNLLYNDKEYYYVVRDEYNNTKDSILFYFLTRTAYNGTIRFNKKGGFNTALHFGRDGIKPDTLKDIILYYHNIMKDKNIEFRHTSFETIIPQNKNDVVFLDPPYSDSSSLYFGNISTAVLENYINNLDCYWYMTFNGFTENKNDGVVKNNEFFFNINYKERIGLISGQSSFSRLKNIKSAVNEYFYIGK